MMLLLLALLLLLAGLLLLLLLLLPLLLLQIVRRSCSNFCFWLLVENVQSIEDVDLCQKHVAEVVKIRSSIFSFG